MPIIDQMVSEETMNASRTFLRLLGGLVLLAGCVPNYARVEYGPRYYDRRWVDLYAYDPYYYPYYPYYPWYYYPYRPVYPYPAYGVGVGFGYYGYYGHHHHYHGHGHSSAGVRIYR